MLIGLGNGKVTSQIRSAEMFRSSLIHTEESVGAAYAEEGGKTNMLLEPNEPKLFMSTYINYQNET